MSERIYEHFLGWYHDDLPSWWNFKLLSSGIEIYLSFELAVVWLKHFMIAIWQCQSIMTFLRMNSICLCMLLRVGWENFARLARVFKVTAVHENYCVLDSISLLPSSNLSFDGQGNCCLSKFCCIFFQRHCCCCNALTYFFFGK